MEFKLLNQEQVPSFERHGLSEERTRITLFLALGSRSEEVAAAFHAVSDVIGYLQTQLKATVPITGFTHSALRPATFTGFWWDGTGARWVQERVATLVIDYLVPMDNADLDARLAELEGIIKQKYEASGYNQDVIWITAQPVMRYS